MLTCTLPLQMHVDIVAMISSSSGPCVTEADSLESVSATTLVAVFTLLL